MHAQVYALVERGSYRAKRAVEILSAGIAISVVVGD